MRTRAILLIAVLAITSAFTTTKENDSNSRKVLVVCFIQDNFTSNFYTVDQLAEANQVEAQMVLQYLNESLTKSLVNLESTKDVDFIACPTTQSASEFKNNIKIEEGICEGKTRCMKSSISSLAPSKLEGFMSECDVNYLMVIKDYKMNYEGEPYYMIRHEISFDVYSASGEHAVTSSISFNTAKLEEWSKVEKKIEKEGKKIAKTLASI